MHYKVYLKNFLIFSPNFNYNRHFRTKSRQANGFNHLSVNAIIVHTNTDFYFNFHFHTKVHVNVHIYANMDFRYRAISHAHSIDYYDFPTIIITIRSSF